MPQGILPIQVSVKSESSLDEGRNLSPRSNNGTTARGQVGLVSDLPTGDWIPLGRREIKNKYGDQRVSRWRSQHSSSTCCEVRS